MRTTWWQITALASLIALAACSKRSEGTGSEGTDNTQTPAQLASSGAVVSDKHVDPKKKLGALIDLVVAAAADLPRAEFDPAALAEKLGKDPQAHFEWVRDHTWWAPYRGLLRGSKGVMLDRVGSSLDRAVLLGDLLRRAGRNVRLAHSELPENAARELLPKVRTMPEEGRIIRTAPVPDMQRQRSAEDLVPGFTEALQGLIVESKRTTHEAALLARSQTEMLYDAVKGAGTSTDTATEKSVLAALRDYWWVEYEDGDKWVVMDVLNPDARSGSDSARSVQYTQWSAASEFPSIPDDDWHTVQIRIVIERYLAGATSESTVLETLLLPAEVFDRPITLVHFPKPWPVEPAGMKSPDALRAAALGVRTWTPILRVGDRYIAQSGFTESGEIKAHPFDPTADLGGGGLFGGLDSALGGGEENEPYASAEWIDYDIHVPGLSNQRVRRPLFDLLGPGRRSARDESFNGSAEDRRLERSEVLLSRTNILLQPANFSWDFVTHLILADIVGQRDAIMALAAERDPAARKARGSAVFAGMNSWGPLLGFAASRFSLEDQRRDSFIGRTHVISHRVGRRLTSGDSAVMAQLIDIAANAVEVHRGITKDPFLVRLQQGVTDTVAELIALTGEIDESANTAAVFDSVDAERPGILIAPRDTAAISSLGWPDDETVRLAEDSNAGFLSYALRNPVELSGIQRVGWWRVDPTTGETIGVMDTGFHVATLEQTINRDRSAELASQFGLASGTGAGSGSSTVLSWMGSNPGMSIFFGSMFTYLVACVSYEIAYPDEPSCNPWTSGWKKPPPKPPSHGPHATRRRHR